MRNYVQYHNVAKQGSISTWVGDKFQIFARKSIQHLNYNRVWLISGNGTKSPKQYQLEYVFHVNQIIIGEPNIATGETGQRFTPPIPLNCELWFKTFLDSQQNFSLGVREIPEQFVAELEILVARD